MFVHFLSPFLSHPYYLWRVILRGSPIQASIKLRKYLWLEVLAIFKLFFLNNVFFLPCCSFIVVRLILHKLLKSSEILELFIWFTLLFLGSHCTDSTSTKLKSEFVWIRLKCAFFQLFFFFCCVNKVLFLKVPYFFLVKPVMNISGLYVSITSSLWWKDLVLFELV